MGRSKKLLVCTAAIALMFISACATGGTGTTTGFEEWELVEPERIPPEVAYQHVRSGDALLVCAYDDEETCGRLRLPDSMTLYQFERNLMYIPVDKEIIFYCA
ncbi:MAG: hypothetical protein C4520_20885 [Candidatus Abyssobacteria bacterium SURF_5]|uniref:ArsR family transcriptional regulator n=1 Tax=Abyssobacteria bacterium (strain SURF_5) TaxID=2093360 RepID=A0A3A4MXS9_ABYX5|nr:MAG: hypothetical protein C4520_20885 [Candidatus Abyssubacteria bacterium SURF_5]